MIFKYSKYYIFIVLLILIFSIGNVCASDSNNTIDDSIIGIAQNESNLQTTLDIDELKDTSQSNEKLSNEDNEIYSS